MLMRTMFSMHTIIFMSFSIVVAVVAFFVTLLYRLLQDHGARDLDELFGEDPEGGA